jgi:hypothetical protein
MNLSVSKSTAAEYFNRRSQANNAVAAKNIPTAITKTAFAGMPVQPLAVVSKVGGARFS